MPIGTWFFSVVILEPGRRRSQETRAGRFYPGQGRIPAAEFDACFDLAYHTRQVHTIFNRMFGEG